MRPEIADNRANWDDRVPLHLASAFYDVPGFLAGRDTLPQVDVDGVGPVEGKSLLHLQCHFGLDTLSWARRGARVTGLDFSAPAIAAARDLAARFVEAEVHDALAATGGGFDVVFTGVGALVWLPAIRPWARVVAGCLAPGGLVWVREMHPMLYTIDEQDPEALRVRYPYFETDAPFTEDSPDTYANDGPDGPGVVAHGRQHCWNHGVGQLVQALLDEGLVLEHLGEHRACDWNALPGRMAQGEDGMWRLEAGADRIPLMLSLRARRPG